MFAVIKTGGKQYKVAKDDVISVEKLEGEPGSKVEFEVLAVGDDKGIETDREAMDKKKVHGEIVGQFKDDKVDVFKFKKRKGYKRLRGHRQNKTTVRITKIA